MATRPLRPALVHLPDAEVEVARAALSADPSGWLPRPAAWCGAETWLVTVEAGSLQRSIECRVSSPWRKGAVVSRHLWWTPRPELGDLVPSGLLPRFSGSIAVRPAVPGALLVLHGSYEVPAGALGAAVDAAVLHRVAGQTASTFLTAVADRFMAEQPPAGVAEPTVSHPSV